MACGIPVITSDTTSLPEVVGDTGITVHPGDIVAVTAAIARLLDEPEYAAALGNRGRTRAQLFSWEAAARETLTIYQAVLKQELE